MKLSMLRTLLKIILILTWIAFLYIEFSSSYFTATVVSTSNAFSAGCWTPKNLSFETGDLTGWTLGEVNQGITVVTDEVYEGTSSARIGYPNGVPNNNPGKNEIYQDFTACGEKFILAYKIFSRDVPGKDEFIYRLTRLSDGLVIDEYISSAVDDGSSPTTTGWQNKIFDISSYQGERLRLYISIGGTEDAFGPTWGYFDLGKEIEEDSEKPSSQVVEMDVFTRSKSFPLYIQKQDNDGGSGVKNVEVWYRKDSGSWTKYGEFINIPVDFDTETVGGDGFYEFYSLARDNLDNLEDVPGEPDTSTLVDTTTTLPGDVVINELMWTGSFGDSADEWLELKNTQSFSIDISGWQLTKKKTTDGSEDLMYTIPEGKTIEAGSFLLISEYDKENSKINVEPDLVVDDKATFALANSNLQIKLYDDSASWNAGALLVDVADDGTGTPMAGDNSNKYSMQRKEPPGEGDEAVNWFTCNSQACSDSQNLYWDVGTIERGTPGGENL